MKIHPKPPRNTCNANQIRDERSGAYLRRGDDGDVLRSVSRPKMFADANAAANARSAMARLSRQARNSSAHINSQRGYDVADAAKLVSPRPATEPPSKSPAIQAARKPSAGRVMKPRSLAPLSAMRFSGVRPLFSKVANYPYFTK